MHRKREKREQSRIVQLNRLSLQKKNLTASTLPGDPQADIKSGPPPRYFKLAKVRKAKADGYWAGKMVDHA